VAAHWWKRARRRDEHRGDEGIRPAPKPDDSPRIRGVPDKHPSAILRGEYGEKLVLALEQFAIQKREGEWDWLDEKGDSLTFTQILEKHKIKITGLDSVLRKVARFQNQLFMEFQHPSRERPRPESFEEEPEEIEDEELEGTYEMASYLRMNDDYLLNLTRDEERDSALMEMIPDMHDDIAGYFPLINHLSDNGRNPFWGIVVSCKNISKLAKFFKWTSWDITNNRPPEEWGPITEIAQFDLQFWNCFAFNWIIEHELFHCRTEMAAMKLQDVRAGQSEVSFYQEYLDRAPIATMRCEWEESCYNTGDPDRNELRVCDYDLCIDECKMARDNWGIVNTPDDGYQYPLEEALANARAFQYIEKNIKKMVKEQENIEDPSGIGFHDWNNYQDMVTEHMKTVVKEAIIQNQFIGYTEYESFVKPAAMKAGEIAITRMFLGEASPSVNAYYDNVLHHPYEAYHHPYAIDEERRLMENDSCSTSAFDLLPGISSMLRGNYQMGVPLDKCPCILLDDEDGIDNSTYNQLRSFFE
jgi:hypothetical protein